MSADRFAESRSPAPLPPDERNERDDHDDHEGYMLRCLESSEYFMRFKVLNKSVPYFNVIPSGVGNIDFNRPRPMLGQGASQAINRDFNAKFTAVIVQRLKVIKPSEKVNADLLKVFQGVERILMDICVKETFKNQKFHLETFTPVGSYVYGTLLATQSPMLIDIALIFDVMPTTAMLKAVGTHIWSCSLNKNNLTSTFGEHYFQLSTPEGYGLRFLFATKCALAATERPPNGIKKNLLSLNSDAIMHNHWFRNLQEDEPETAATLAVLVLAIKDLASRNTELKLMGPWVTMVLAHYVLTKDRPENSPRLLTQSLLDFFRLLASGFLMSYTRTMPDPTCPTLPVQGSLSHDAMIKVMKEAGIMLQKFHRPGGFVFVLPEGKEHLEIDQSIKKAVEQMEATMIQARDEHSKKLAVKVEVKQEVEQEVKKVEVKQEVKQEIKEEDDAPKYQPGPSRS